MNESKVRFKESVIEIVVIVVDLWGGELTFVDDVGGGQGADVEGFGEAPANNTTT